MIQPDRRRVISLVATYAVLGAIWAGVARWAAPPIIEATYLGRSLPALNRYLRGDAGSPPVERPYDLWRTFSGAVLFAGLLHLSVVLIVRAQDRRLAGDATGEDRRVSLGLVLVSLAFLAVTALAGVQHDYVPDLQIWDEVRRGHDPWWTMGDRHEPLNAYGPLFNLLAPLAWVNPLAPKLLFAYTYVLFAVWLVGDIRARGRLAGLPAVGLMAWLWNPLPWVEVATFGHFDVLVGVAAVAALEGEGAGATSCRGRAWPRGCCSKYIPLVILPFLAFEGGRFRPRLAIAAALPIVLGLAASGYVWGPSTFLPLSFAATRESRLLSIFRFLRGTESPLHRVWGVPDVDMLSTPCLVAALLWLWAWCQLRKVDAPSSAVLALLTTLLFYKVGFPQYQIVLFLLFTYWATRGPGRPRVGLPVAIAAAGYFAWIAAFDVFYWSIGGFILGPDRPWGRVGEVAGLPTFLLGLRAAGLPVAGIAPIGGPLSAGRVRSGAASRHLRPGRSDAVAGTAASVYLPAVSPVPDAGQEGSGWRPRSRASSCTWTTS